ncbi:MAG: ABC transporter permease subunit [Candidatus Saccharimonadales bacterium]
MLRNIFQKTLFERRSQAVIWIISITGFSILILSLFPTFRDTFGEALQNVPEDLRNLMGDASAYRTIEGYIDTVLFSRIVFLALILGIVAANGLLSAEEGDGRLQTLLAQPVSRNSVYWQKYLGLSIFILTALIGMVFGTVLGTLVIGEISNVDYPRLLSGVLMVWLLTMTFASLAFCIGGLRKGPSGLITGLLAFTLFLIDSLAGTATALKSINNFSPFKYFNDPGIMQFGINWRHAALLAAGSIVLAIIGWAVFVRRDVYPR